MRDFLRECQELGVGSRIVKSCFGVELLEVQELGGGSWLEFERLNHIEESHVDKWVKMMQGRDYEGDEVLLALVLELYKKVEKIEKKLFACEDALLSLPLKVKVISIGHEVLCLEEELAVGGLYYGRMDLPMFPSKYIPFYLEMLTPRVGKIIKMGANHSRSYDAYVVECERISIREKRRVYEPVD